MTAPTITRTDTAVLKVTARSGNAKTGPIPVTSRAQWSCPKSCPLMGTGCYGENRGRNPRTLFELADSGETVHSVETLAAGMRQGGSPRKGQRVQRAIARDREVGDVLTASGEIDRAYLSIVARAGAMVRRVVFGYSHVPELTADDIPDNYVMNASCETPAGVRDAWSRGLPAVIVGDRGALAATDPGPRYVSCPAESRDVTCAECGLCARPSRMADPASAPVIVFDPHGTARAKVRATIATLNA